MNLELGIRYMGTTDSPDKINKQNGAGEPNVRILQAVLIAISLVAIAAGVLRGELTDIFRKATLVCLECIGIG